MKAIIINEFGGPEVLKWQQVADPVAGPAEVVVAVRAVGVNPVETYVRKGIYGPRTFPFVPGSDASGVVESVGANVTRFKPGDRVYTGGTVGGAYAQNVLCKESQVYRLPEKVSFQQGAAIHIPYATAYRALYTRADARAGETVLVHGASGGVGTAAVQIARAAGLTVYGTAGTDAGRRLVLGQGAHYVLDHTTDDYLQRAVEMTGGGFNIILEMLANQNLGKDLSALARHGRVVVIGSRGKVEIDARNAMMRDASILGMTLMNADEKELASIHAALVAGLENGSLRPVIGAEFPLADAGKAHEKVMVAGAYGKIVLIP